MKSPGTSALLVALLLAPAAQAERLYTAEQLRRESGAAQHAAVQRAKRARATDLTSLFPERAPEVEEPAPAAVPAPAAPPAEPPPPPPRVEAPAEEKVSHAKLSEPADPGVEARSAPRPAATSPAPEPGRYSPPPRRSGGSGAPMVSVVLAPEQSVYGIALGTWARARLPRDVTSADAGVVEIELAEDLAGRHRVLPAGTLLLGRQRFNRGNQRLDLEVHRALTPEAEELEVRMRVFDLQKRAGLPGLVSERAVAESAQEGAQSGTLRAGQTLLRSLASQGGLPGQVLADAGDEVLSDTRRRIDDGDGAQRVIAVAAQQVFVRVEESF